MGTKYERRTGAAAAVDTESSTKKTERTNRVSLD